MFLGVTSLLLLLGDLRAVSLCWCLKSSKRGTTAGKTKSVQERKRRKETDGPGAEGGLGNRGTAGLVGEGTGYVCSAQGELG